MYIYQNLLKMRIIVNLIITAAVAYFLPKVLSGVHFLDFSSAVIFAVVLGLLNIFLKPVLKIISFPISVITFGLFSLVVNAVVVSVADYFVDGMVIDGFGWTLVFSVCLSILTSILSVDED